MIESVKSILIHLVFKSLMLNSFNYLFSDYIVYTLVASVVNCEYKRIVFFSMVLQEYNYTYIQKVSDIYLSTALTKIMMFGYTNNGLQNIS